MMDSTGFRPNPACRWCGLTHGALCPAVRSIEFCDDGVTIKKVEFHPPPVVLRQNIRVGAEAA